MTTVSGVKIVLTAPVTEMGEFEKNPFATFFSGFTTLFDMPSFFQKSFSPPALRTHDGKARYAPYGLRKVEAMLLESGFAESDVAVVHPQDLAHFIGPNTKVIGVSSMDPTGMGYVSTTYSSIIGSVKLVNEFQKLLRNKSIRKFKPKIVVGGFGSWQLERKHMTDKYGVDCVLIGGRPDAIIDVFKKAVNGESLPRVVRADENMLRWDYTTLPLIKHAAIHGAVEISKGCGRNCQFCTPTMQVRVDIPLEKIMREVALTTSEGCDHITLITEDLFMYGVKTKDFKPNREAVVKLVRKVADYSGVKSIQPSHMSLAPVVNNPQMVKELGEILIERSVYQYDGKPIITTETGVETGSARLMKKYMNGKMLPYKPEQWQDIVYNAFGILNDNHWHPLATLIVGLPDEKEADVLETLELLDELKDYNAFYVPLLFIPLEGKKMDSLSKARRDVFIRCWEYNFRIWKKYLRETKKTNPPLYMMVNNILIPSVGRIAGFYGIKRDEQLKQAFRTFAMAQKPIPKNFSGIRIELRAERWHHIIFRHPELKDKKKLVRTVASDPDEAYVDLIGAVHALKRLTGELSDYLVVIINLEGKKVGYIRTAYYTSSARKTRRYKTFRKLKLS